MSSLYVAEGHALQLISRSSHTAVSEYEGEWMSELLPVTGSVLCVTLSISVPKEFAVLAKLFGLYEPQIVYKASNERGSNPKYAMELYSVFEVPLSASDVSHVQLVIYVSVGVTIKTVDMANGHCDNNCMYPRLFLMFENSGIEFSARQCI